LDADALVTSRSLEREPLMITMRRWVFIRIISSSLPIFIHEGGGVYRERTLFSRDFLVPLSWD